MSVALTDKPPENNQGINFCPDKVQATLGFTSPADVSADHERSGLLRAATLPRDVDFSQVLDFHTCQINDWSAAGAEPLNLETMGFDTIDLSGNTALQARLEQVRQAGKLNEADIKAIRHHLLGKAFTLTTGKRLRLLYIAPEGFIIRKAGPNGLIVDPDEEMTEMNGHDGALAVHGDQDVFGTPVKQILKGFAPMLFRHNTPDGCNRLSPFFLVNMWIPLQQITRPLTLMDRRSLDSRKHQLRYALPIDSFLERDEDRQLNDIWTFLHSENQQWHFSSEMNAKRAYVFDTLGLAHGASILPGEDIAEQFYKQLQAVQQAILTGDKTAITAAAKTKPFDLPADCTVPLRHAVECMHSLLAEAQKQGEQLINDTIWQQNAAQAMDRVIRKSIEMRVVAFMPPKLF